MVDGQTYIISGFLRENLILYYFVFNPFTELYFFVRLCKYQSGDLMLKC